MSFNILKHAYIYLFKGIYTYACLHSIHSFIRFLLYVYVYLYMNAEYKCMDFVYTHTRCKVHECVQVCICVTPPPLLPLLWTTPLNRSLWYYFAVVVVENLTKNIDFRFKPKMCTCTYTYTCMICIYIYTYICDIYVNVHIIYNIHSQDIYTHTIIQTNIYAYIQICTYTVQKHVYMELFVKIYIYVCIYSKLCA